MVLTDQEKRVLEIRRAQQFIWFNEMQKSCFNAWCFVPMAFIGGMVIGWVLR